MAFSLDPELLAAILALPPERLSRQTFARGDVEGIRAFSHDSLRIIEAALPELPEVTRTDVTVTSYDGVAIPARWYSPAGQPALEPRAAVVYLHGGGMIAGSMPLYDRTVASYVVETGLPMLSVDYRLAPEHPHPAPVEDAFAAVWWLRENATELGVDPTRLAVMGDSAGGGLAAGAALLARDRELPLARQVLIYPMLDDRTTTPDPHLEPYAGWSYDDNYTGWHALLGDALGTDGVPYGAAPARAADLAGVADAYVEVGELDIFRDEAVAYARRLAAAGVSVELHVHTGCPHGFDRIGVDVAVVRRARADRDRVLQNLTH